MKSWKTNLLNLNSTISNELKTKASMHLNPCNAAAAKLHRHGYNKYSNINNKSNNIILQNNKYENVKSYLSNINNAINGSLESPNTVNFQYLNNCLNNTKLSLIKYSFSAGSAPKGGPVAKQGARKKGSIIKYNNIIGYNFVAATANNIKEGFSHPAAVNQQSFRSQKNNAIIKNTYKLLFIFFKSMYCLISKPVIKYTNDKVTIQLFYYLNIPKKKIFRLFSILYINSIKNKWLLNKNSRYAGGSSSLFIRWKVRKALSRFKNKNNKSLLFNLRKFDLTKVFFNKFKLICEILSNKFNKPVELQLTRLHHPIHDSNILVNLLALNIKNKRKKANWAIKKVYSKNQIKDLNDPALTQPCGGFSRKNIPAFLSGLNIKIAGRLMREPIIPRITTKVFEKGASATGKVNYLDVASITRKNRKGAYTIKVTSGQNFF